MMNPRASRLSFCRASSVIGIGRLGRGLFLAVMLMAFAVHAAQAQAVSGSVALTGNHPFEASTFHPLARPNTSTQLHMQITLGLHNRGALDKLLRDLQNPASPRYHQWLTPAQFNQRFGPSQQDLDAVVQWLAAQGLKVTGSNLAQRYVRFTGAVADAERVFNTNIMTFGKGEAYSNVTDPVIPARFSGVVTAVGGLDNFLHSKAVAQPLLIRPQTGATASAWSAGPLALLDPGPALPMPRHGAVSSVPEYNFEGEIAFGPTDVYSFYNETPLLNVGVNGGGGGCLGVVGDSNYTPGAVSLFNSTFGLPPSNITTVLVDGTNPGVTGDELEALLDLEWTHAIAPGAASRFYLGDPNADTPNGPIVDGIAGAVGDNACGTIGVSFGLCGGSAAFYMEVVSPIYAQAAVQGQSILIASGDEGAAGIVLDPSGTMCVAGTSRNINELGGDPNVTQVGGTFFTPNYNASGDNVGNVAESAWDAFYSNPPSPPEQLATGGGASAYYAKPAYQKGLGVPADGARDVPDVALVAALSGSNGPGVFIGNESAGSPFIDCCILGTSLSVQAFAGIARLIEELKGGRLGPLNPRIYALANAGLAASGFRDVTMGNNSYGSVIGFNAGPGFDQTTGWGTVDIGTFATKYAPLVISVPSPILVGSSFAIKGNFFTPHAMVNFFVSTANGPIKAVLTPSEVTTTQLTVPVPATVPLGQGFVDVQVVNTDLSYESSNPAPALLQGYAPAGIPTLTDINGWPLAASSSDPDFATNNVETVTAQGHSVTLGGSGFDAVNGVAVNVFCPCPPNGNAGPVYVNPGEGGLTSTSFSFTLPANVPTGPASLAVVNKGNYISSNAVSVPVGSTISVTSVSQSGSTITVKGTGFSTLTVINFFNLQGATAVNLGGLTGGVKKIPLNVINSTQFTFTRPLGAVAGPSYVQALNPPYLPYTSSGNAPGGAFNLE